MKLCFSSTDRVLAVVAHPDDAELLCAGTLARAADEGATIGVCVMCQGDKGQPAEPIDNLAEVRAAEMQAAADRLGATLYLAGIADGTLADDLPTRQKLLGVFRQFRPTLVLAHSLDDYHADHRAAGALAEGVSWFAASRGQVSQQPPLDAPPALWWIDTIDMHGFQPGFYVDISRYASVKLEMLSCHRSQLQRRGDTDFAPLSEMVSRQMQARGAQASVTAAEAFRIHTAFKRTAAW